MSPIDFLTRGNADYLETVHEQYLREPSSVSADWALFFAGFELARGQAAPVSGAIDRLQQGAADLVHTYRELGHLVAKLDPLGCNASHHPLLELGELGLREADLDRPVSGSGFGTGDATVRQLREHLRAVYCGTLAYEYLDIADKEQRTWLQAEIEREPGSFKLTHPERRRILAKLIAAEEFEHFLQTKFLGQKRFSLEGGEALIPLLDRLTEDAGDLGVAEVVVGMAHRGRLNVLCNVMGKPYEAVFSEFEGALLQRGIEGDGDVKYHLGYSRDHVTGSGHRLHMSLAFNPSHLEAVNPVVEGVVRAKQRRVHDITERTSVVPLLIHGDAAFTGQGIVTETLALSQLEGYKTGGTVHVIIDNQVGFTTSPEDFRSTRYPSDIAKVMGVPVFHVNGDDPEAAARAARLAIAFRQRFRQDVIIHVVCYRRYGHNETDDPTFTQPLMYAQLAHHPTTRKQYAERLIAEGVLTEAEHTRETEAFRDLLRDALDYTRDFKPRQQIFALGGAWKGLAWAGDDWSAKTAVSADLLRKVVDGVRRYPPGFDVHPKVRRLYEQRAEMLQPGGQLDWGCGELLAFGTLLLEGTPIRLSGQDVGRGTFSHRHAVLRDIQTNAKLVPLANLEEGQAVFQVVNSMLSEYAVLGFEYGFSMADPRNLVIWEAQFGDFANGAQIIIDQFIASAESKWQRMSGLVMLLQHGYEGQGPEHSSARLERFLQLCADKNMQVCNLTTPAQLFHALRRQMKRAFRKPLVVMSPKSLLRHKLAVSSLADFTDANFQNVLPESDPLDAKKVKRLVLCSGKVYYDLLQSRRDRKLEEVALVRVEQLYPFPTEEVREVLAGYPKLKEVVWAQEEPANMGGWPCVSHWLQAALGDRLQASYAGREAAASPATGSYKLHNAEVAELLTQALGR